MDEVEEEVDSKKTGRGKGKGGTGPPEPKAAAKCKAGKNPKYSTHNEAVDLRTCKRCAVTKAIDEYDADQWTCKDCDSDERGWKRSVLSQLGPDWLATKEAEDPDLVVHAKGCYVAARKAAIKGQQVNLNLKQIIEQFTTSRGVCN